MEEEEEEEDPLMGLKGARIAELVELWLKSQVQYWCGFESLMQQGIFLPESTFGADSLTVFVQPLCAITWLNICVQVKNPQTLAATPFLHTQKYCTHWQEWVALLFWLLCLAQVRWPKFPSGRNGVLKKERKKKKKKKKKEDDLQDTL